MTEKLTKVWGTIRQSDSALLEKNFQHHTNVGRKVAERSKTTQNNQGLELRNLALKKKIPVRGLEPPRP